MTLTQAHELHSETLLTNYAFDGARADLSKSLSMNPMFQVTHSFHLGSQTSPPTYHFGAMFANDKVRGPLAENMLPPVQPAYFVPQAFLHGNIDNDGNLSGRFNQGWSANNVSKAQAQVRRTSRISRRRHVSIRK